MAEFGIITLEDGRHKRKMSQSHTWDFDGLNIGSNKHNISDVDAITINLDSKNLGGLLDPVSAQQAATKNYVDGLTGTASYYETRKGHSKVFQNHPTVDVKLCWSEG